MKLMHKNRFLAYVITLTSTLITVALLAGVFMGREVEPLALVWRPYILIPLFSVLTNLYLLYLIHMRRKSIKAAPWIGLFVLGTLMWSLTDLASFAAANPYTALIVRTGIPLAELIGIPALLMFVIQYTREEPEDLTVPWFFIVMATFIISVFATEGNFFFIREIATLVPRIWGFEIKLGPLGALYLVWFQVFTVVIVGILIRYYAKERKGRKARQARYLLLGIFIPIIGTTITNVLPAWLGLPFYLPLDSFFFTIMGVVMCYGIIRYSLFGINPASIATNILETMAESVIVADPQFELEYANANAEKVFGLDATFNKRTKIDHFFAPQHLIRIKQYLAEDPLLKTPRKLENLVAVTQNTHHITPIDLALSSILDEKGKLAGYVFVMTDISDLKRAYAQLAEEERKIEKKVIERTEQLYTEHAKLEASIASLPVGFIMLDENMKVLELNKVAQDLFKIKTKTGKAVEAVLHKLGVKDQFERVHAECELADIPELLLDKKTLHLIISPIIGSRNDCIGSVLLIEDITKQKLAEKERNEFIVTASHEMRTPLTIVQGNLANALDPEIAKLDKDAKPLIQQAYDSTAQLAELFTDIMTVSEIDNGTAPHYENKTEFDYVTVIDDVIRRVRPKADAKKLALSFSGHEKKVNLKGDPNEVKQIITKLADNAIKYTTKGYVSLELKEHGKWVLLSVTDTGTGIETADRKRLFKKFARLDNSLTREIGGTGLGLYIAQSLAERNNGEVMLEHSTKKGSVFTLKLPLK